MTCEQVQQDLTLELLGRLELDEDTRRHLERCPECAAERASLLPVRELLGFVELEDVLADEAPFEAERMTSGLLERLARQRRVQRRRVASWFALAATVVVAGGIGLASMLATGPTSLIATASDNGVQASAHFTAVHGGSAVDLSVQGVRRGTNCRMLVIADDGSRQVLITWVADYGGTATVHTRTRFAIKDIAKVTIREVAGPTLLTIPVSA